MRRGLIGVVAATAALTGAAAAPAMAAPPPYPFQQNDFGGFHNILPPGQGQNVNALEAAEFLGGGNRPPHDDDQLRMYSELVYATPGLPGSRIGEFFKDASFGVAPGDVESTYQPLCILPTAPQSDSCEKVTIQRDGFGVPHINGETRLGAMFGAGYATAEDRLFFIDVLRHAGRGELSSFAGGANVEMDRDVWESTPYHEEELQRQFDLGDDVYGAEGAQLQQDVRAYVDGVNQYIAEAQVDPSKMPAEYAALGQPAGPEPWKVTDTIAAASLVAGIFGKGGGNEVESALVLEQAKERFGRRQGKRVWADFRSQNDPEAPTTVQQGAFPYQKAPKKAKKVRGLALPDPGTTQDEQIVVSRNGNAAPADAGGLTDGLLSPIGGTDSASNALLVSGAESESGRPLAVMGPQVSYFSPAILMEQDLHAPATGEGPAIDARGSAFPGTNLYVQLGRGQDYAWSATSAGQDITDTFAVPLCEPDGSAPTLASSHYLYRGQCLAFDVLEKENCWQVTFVDDTPPGCETMRALRSALGIVTHRAMIKGQPYAYTKLRVTYFHEVDSALGFSDFNNPDKVNSPESFQQAACRIQYTFNWFYIDNQHIAYFNSGKNPVRPKGVDPNFPTQASHEWQGFEPEELGGTNEAQQTPCSEHPQVIDQSYLTSWNNKQAKKYSAADDNFGYGSVYRSEPLDDRIKAGIAGAETMNLPELVDAMEDAGTVDLRGDAVLPWILKVIKRGPVNDPDLRGAISTLKAWQKAGAHRRDANADGTYEHAEAIRIMDAWWPELVRAQFRPLLGGELYDSVVGMQPIDDENRTAHMGSAFQGGWWGYVEKDLRTMLQRTKKRTGEKGPGQASVSAKGGKGKVKGAYSRVYCGGGKLNACRRALLSSLEDAIAVPASQLYPGVEDCTQGDAQWCSDAIEFRPVGVLDQPFIHWINRPTFQQVVEVQGHR